MRRSSLLFALMAVALIVMPAAATVIHIPGDYGTIQAGINAGIDGDTVLVAAGTYSEHISYMGKDIVVKSESGPEVTMIQAETDYMPIIEINQGEPSSATLEGFNISNASNLSAVRIQNSGATLKGNIFIDNHGGWDGYDGGAVNAVNGTILSILNNVFRSNSCFNAGGAIRAYGIKLICSGNEFYENTADQAGAIHLRANDNSVIDHNLFVRNSSTQNCGAVTFSECNGGEFFNNTLSENSDTGDRNAAGLVIWTSSNINIYNNIVVNNIGKGLYGYESTDCPATYNDVWENTVNYDGISPGIGSISADPLFVGGNPFSYHLLVGSPCIDSGDPESPLDPDGTRADMGAYYVGGDSEIGYIAGIVFDPQSNPFSGVIVTALGSSMHDTTDAAGYFILGELRCGRTYDVHFSYYGYSETTLTDIVLNPNDTTNLGIIQLRKIPTAAIAGTVYDSLSLPFQGVEVEILNSPYADTTSMDGYFIFDSLLCERTYDIRLSHSGYLDTILTHIEVYPGDITILNVMLRPHHTIIHVPSEYATIQEGINAAVNGDTVLVGPGIFNGSLNFNGRNITVASQFLLARDTSLISATVITGGDTLVAFNHGENSSAKLIGFRITGGTIGVYVFDAGPQIMNNIIDDNHNTADGGGIFWHGGTLAIGGNRIANNSANRGAAIWAEVCDGDIDHNLIFDNQAFSGLGIYLYGVTTVNILNNTICHNGYGYGYSHEAIFIENDVYHLLDVSVYNNIVAFNGFGVYYDAPDYPGMDYNDFYDNTGGNYGQCQPGPNDISLDPQFVGGDPFNYRLAANSPCIDAGRPSDYDPDGSRIDMGAIWPPIGDYGYIAGTVNDDLSHPIANAVITVLNHTYRDTTGVDGRFICGPLRTDMAYDLLISKYGFYDSTMAGVTITADDTTFLGTIVLRTNPCAGDTLYISGDINGDGDATPLADVIYGHNSILGGPPSDSAYCTDHYFYAAADVNNNCWFNGIDITYLTEYWCVSSYAPHLHYCETCHPPQPDPVLPPSGSDPGIPDTIIMGNLDLTPILAVVGDTVSIPVWVRNDESVPAINIPLAIDTSLAFWVDGIRRNPLSGWNNCTFLPVEQDQSLPGYNSQTLIGWRLTPTDSMLINTSGDYLQVASFRAVFRFNPGSIGDTIQIVPGSHSRSGGLAFCDSTGTSEWSPVIIGAQAIITMNPSHIGLSPSAIIDTLTWGLPDSTRLVIGNLGANDLFYNLDWDSTFAFLDRSGGTLQNNQSDTVLISFAPTAHDPGTYLSDITVFSNDSSQSLITVPLTLVVIEGAPFGIIEGQVIDSWQYPLDEVLVNVNPSGVSCTTGTDGRYSLGPITSQTYDITFSRAGYQDTTVVGFVLPPYDTVSLDMRMMNSPDSIIYVPDQYPTISAAIEAAANGNIIRVAEGTYNEHFSFLGKRITVVSQNGPDVTILEPDTENVSIVEFINDEDTASVLSGFTLRNAHGAPAVNLYNAGATLQGNVFTGNDNNSGDGGAVSGLNDRYATTLKLINNIFDRNAAFRDGGAVYTVSVNLLAWGNIFTNDTCGYWGGAISLQYSEGSTIHHNLFYHNQCDSRGGAVFINASFSGDYFYNNTVVSNRSVQPQYGAAVSILQSAGLHLFNNIIVQNDGIALLNDPPDHSNTTTYSDVWGNDQDYVGFNPGEGSISEDPLLMGGYPYSFELLNGSPCIDAGDPNSPLDPDGTRADMGAFYHQGGGCSYVVGDANGNGVFNGLDVTYGVAYFKGGPPPPIRCDICPEPAPFYAGGDVNGSCSFNGLDITYMVAYFKGGPLPYPCPDCPPAELLAPPAPGVGPIPAVQPILVPNQRIKPKAGNAE